MKNPFRKAPSSATAIATLALVVAVGGGTAFAASSALPPNSVGATQIKAGAVTNTKLGDSSVSLDKLTPGTQAALTGQRPVTTLGGTSTWSSYNGGGGTSSITSAGALLGNTGTSGYAGISTTALNNLTPQDLSTISYSASQSGTTLPDRATPYFKLKLQPSGGDCGDDDIVYNPSVQSDNLDYAGQTETFDVTAPYSVVGVNTDDNPVNGSYPLAIHGDNNAKSPYTTGKNVSSEPICLAEMVFGSDSGAAGGTATIYNATFAGKGLKQITYTFGS